MGGFTAASLIRAGARVTSDPHDGDRSGASVDATAVSASLWNGRGLVSMAVEPGACGQVVRPARATLLHETGKLLVEQPRDRHAMESWRTMRDAGLRADRLGQGRVERNGRVRGEQATVDRLGGVLDAEVILQGLAAWLGNEGVAWRGRPSRCSQGGPVRPRLGRIRPGGRDHGGVDPPLGRRADKSAPAAGLFRPPALEGGSTDCRSSATLVVDFMHPQ